MEENNNQTNQQQTTTENRQDGAGPVAKLPTDPMREVQKISAWAMIICAILFAIVAILAIWGAFTDNDGFVWKSLATLAVIAFCSLMINVGSRIYDNAKNK